MTKTDTIAALATARGVAALALVRTSGPEAVSVVNRCFRGPDLTAVASHTAHVGYLQAADGRDLDQVVVTVFRAPRTATGEDVVEVSCHGGTLAPLLILESLLDHGARMAAPGEFTQRAFLNGKLDLAQAEAVADLIHAGSTQAHRVSLSQLQGRYSAVIGQLRDELLELAAFVELELDFAEEDVEFADRERLVRLLDGAEALLTDLLASVRTGEVLRDGVRVVIGGRPNAGKSTLLNALLGQERAIVSEVPGTTRDEIEAEMELRGVRVRFVDTAGLRATADAIEAEGVRRAQRSIAASDVLVYVYDRTQGLDADERTFLANVQADRPDLAVVLVANKADLPAAVEAPGTEVLARAHLALSAQVAQREAAVLRPLQDTVLDVVAADLSRAEASPVVMNQRHRHHLHHALDAVQRAQAALAAGHGGDTLALDLRAALHELGAITGAITTEDVLDQIFSRFCIGK
ncbi:MAG: tRNA uridine-5-carboxymethylaminomethyl(34) synthesis GTPase MnmE [Bacteroidota bacterium]